MKKFYSLLLCVLAFVGVANAQEDLGKPYEGSITIQLPDGKPSELPNQVVYINANADNTSCTFGLYNFCLDPSMPATALGDIVVPNVAISQENDSKHYAGSIDEINLSLMGNPIIASAALDGIETKNGELDMNIAVVWIDAETKEPIMPISVIFKGKAKEGGVNGIVANSAAIYGANGAINFAGYNGVANIYTIAGQLVKTAKIANTAAIEMPVGIYFVRTNAGATKVIVK